jgi:hypothetical protein
MISAFGGLELHACAQIDFFLRAAPWRVIPAKAPVHRSFSCANSGEKAALSRRKSAGSFANTMSLTLSMSSDIVISAL